MLSVLLAIGSLLFANLSCSTAFKLPEVEAVVDMEETILLSYDTWSHHSVAFYRNSMLVEFTYGDWDIFALNRRDAWTARKNMTFLTQGALGRKIVAREPNSPLCPLFKGYEQVKLFLSPVSKSQKLYDNLQSAYREQLNTQVFNQVEQVYFVTYKVSYWGLHNCNHELANWLEELGG